MTDTTQNHPGNNSGQTAQKLPKNSPERTLERRIESRFSKALATYRLVEDGDKVLVALSGGKDSLCLLELLGRRARISRPSFSVEAVHVRMENVRYESDTRYLQRFAEAAGVPLHIVTTRFDDTRPTTKPACFLCSWHRRKAIFNLAQALGCNKIALGHHRDDIIHTALMNQFFQGHFSTMPVRLKMKKMPLTIIRPLCLEDEADIAALAELRDYEKQIKLCPYEKASHRAEMKRLFAEVERISPEARYSMWNALEAEGKLIEE